MADYTVTAANVIASTQAIRYVTPGVTSFEIKGDAQKAIPKVLVAGETITAGQPVYQNSSSLAIYKADANASDPAYKVIGISENGAAAGQPISVCESDPAFTPGCTMAIGDVVILSATAGGITEAANKASGWFVSSLGVAYSTTQMDFKIVRSDVAKA